MPVVARIIQFGDPRLPERYWRKVALAPQRTCCEMLDCSWCWTWTGSKTSKGYGSFYLGKDRRGRQRTGVAHKMTYELAHGPVPRRRGKRLVIDHRCRNRACVNPEHHELVVEPVNVARGESPSARHARKTHCPRGHEYSPENTYVLRIRRDGRDTTKRYCRTCRRNGTSCTS